MAAMAALTESLHVESGRPARSETRESDLDDLERLLGKKWADAGARSKLRRMPGPPSFPSGEPPAIEEAIG